MMSPPPNKLYSRQITGDGKSFLSRGRSTLPASPLVIDINVFHLSQPETFTELTTGVLGVASRRWIEDDEQTISGRRG
jgi:hypothetical protein